jgi:phosphoglucan,water dikinase
MPLSRDLPVAAALGKRLAALARVIEEEFGSPQDIEGAIVGDQVYLVQSRPQQGLGRA